MILGLADLDALIPVFNAARQACRLTAFEFFTHACVEQVCLAHNMRPPLDEPATQYVLMEFERPDGVAEEQALAVFEAMLEAGRVVDGVLAQNEAQARALWHYREWISESITPRTPYKNDVAVRIGQVTEFLAGLEEIVGRHFPDFEVLWYGHIGDGNLHMNVLRPRGMSINQFHDICEALTETIYAQVDKYQGSISAEHGVGVLKRDWLHHSRGPGEMALFRSIKQAFDPQGILNPGKLFLS